MPPRLWLSSALGLLCASGLLAGLGIGHTPLAADRPATPPMPGASASSPLPPGDTVVARVDGIELRLSDVEAAQQNLPPQAQKLPLAQIYPMLLERIVDGMLVTEAGRKDRLDQDPDVQLRLKRYEDRVIQEAYLNRAIKQAETEDRLKARYQTYVKEKAGHEEVHARHILVKTEAEATSVIAELDKGADFADTAFALPAGQYSKTPVKTEFGWHVIKVEDHRVSTPPSFEEAQEELRQLVARDIVDARLKELRGAAKIETFGLDGKPLPAGK